MSEQNGQKTRIIWWLIGVLQAIVISGWMWAANSIVQAKSDISSLQTSSSSIQKSLEVIQTDIKILLQRK